jgi:bifunctional non-homologous end joining protein LigD
MAERLSSVPGPALATLTHERFSGDRWVYERKLDGVRSLAYYDGDRAWLRSRTGGDQGPAFPEVVEALEAQQCPSFVVDGEVVAFDGAQTSFGADPSDQRRAGPAHRRGDLLLRVRPAAS